MCAGDPPQLVVISGANGAGKSTVAPRLLHGTLGLTEFVNADTIARGLSAFNPEGMALSAGRIMLARLRQLAANRDNFAFETTLASKTFAPWLRKLIATGYSFHLVFLWLPNSDLAVARVAERVRAGGHDVPEETIRRRYNRGLLNFFKIYRPIATTWQVFDNTHSQRATLIAEGGQTVPETIKQTETWSRIIRSIYNDR